MKNKQQLLQEQKQLRTKLAQVTKQINLQEVSRMQEIAGVKPTKRFLRENFEEGDDVWGGNDQTIYDTLLDFDHEQLISDMMEKAENNPSLTLVDYLKEYDYSEDNDNNELNSEEELV